jgi:hypothetical protein
MRVRKGSGLVILGEIGGFWGRKWGIHLRLASLRHD